MQSQLQDRHSGVRIGPLIFKLEIEEPLAKIDVQMAKKSNLMKPSLNQVI